jgi:hypothetical protein
MTDLRNYSESRDPASFQNRSGWTLKAVKKEVELCLDNSDWVYEGVGSCVLTIHMNLKENSILY